GKHGSSPENTSGNSHTTGICSNFLLSGHVSITDTKYVAHPCLIKLIAFKADTKDPVAHSVNECEGEQGSVGMYVKGQVMEPNPMLELQEEMHEDLSSYDFDYFVILGLVYLEPRLLPEVSYLPVDEAIAQASVIDGLLVLLEGKTPLQILLQAASSVPWVAISPP
ncbi:hypothetical protein ACLOJK_022421, partial [Asimina triloba]